MEQSLRVSKNLQKIGNQWVHAYKGLTVAGCRGVEKSSLFFVTLYLSSVKITEVNPCRLLVVFN